MRGKRQVGRTRLSSPQARHPPVASIYREPDGRGYDARLLDPPDQKSCDGASSGATHAVGSPSMSVRSDYSGSSEAVTSDTRSQGRLAGKRPTRRTILSRMRANLPRAMANCASRRENFRYGNDPGAG